MCGCWQLAPWIANDTDRTWAAVRWGQTYDFGYTPNDLLQRFFTAVVLDTADIGGPNGA